jgi:enoyl-CoA hydratase/carnithine racemase
MELTNIVYEKSECVGTITLNRPGKLNLKALAKLADYSEFLNTSS